MSQFTQERVPIPFLRAFVSYMRSRYTFHDLNNNNNKKEFTKVLMSRIHRVPHLALDMSHDPCGDRESIPGP